MNLKNFYPRRSKWSYKGQSGSVLIISGSEQYSGSPIFNAMSALRSGADLVFVIGHKRAMNIAAGFSPDIITFPLDDELNPEHVPKIVSAAGKCDSMIIGCGLVRNSRTHEAIRKIIKNICLPMVVDAEAIRAVAGNKKIFVGKKAVLTPHTEEFRILTGSEVKKDIKNRREKVKEHAKKLNVAILLKGYVDVISDGNELVLNRTGSPFMTKGGFGDTLSGVCGALLARGAGGCLVETAAAAACINGKAGEMASEKYRESVLASDIFEFLPKAIRQA